MLQFSLILRQTAPHNLDPKKLVSITTDNASNIRLACQLLKWKRLSCFGHNQDLAINKGLNDQRIDRVINLCRKVVAAFSHSWKRKRDLQEVQEQKNLPVKQLKGDVSTRWGSKAGMNSGTAGCNTCCISIRSQDITSSLKLARF